LFIIQTLIRKSNSNLHYEKEYLGIQVSIY